MPSPCRLSRLRSLSVALTRSLVVLPLATGMAWGCSTAYESDLADRANAAGAAGTAGGAAAGAAGAGQSGTGGVAGKAGGSGAEAAGAGGIAGASGGGQGGAGIAGGGLGGGGAAGGGAGGAAGGGAGIGGSSPAGGLPGRPTGSTLLGGGTQVAFIARRTFLGTRTEALAPSTSQWKRYGLNWDARTTTESVGGVGSPACVRPVPNPGSPLAVIGAPGFIDGEEGRDNAFGGTLLPLLSLFQSSPEVGADEAIADGGPTLVLRIGDLSDSADDTLAPGELFFTQAGDVAAMDPEAVPPQERKVDAASASYVVAENGIEKIFDWPDDGKLPELAPGQVFRRMTSRLRFPNAYVKNNVWVSGDLVATTSGALLPIGGGMIRVDTLATVIVVELSPLDHRNASTARLSFVSAPNALNQGLSAPTSPLFKCGAGASITLDARAGGFAETADLAAPAPGFADADITCNAVSGGIGLQLVPTRIAELPGSVAPFHYECSPEGMPIRVLGAN